MASREDTRLVDYLYGELSAKEAEEYRRELESDPSAAEELAAHEHVLETLRKIEDEEPSPHLDALILARAREAAEEGAVAAREARGRGWLRRLLDARWAGVAVAGSLAVVAAVILVPVTMRSRGPSQELAFAPAQSPPATITASPEAKAGNKLEEAERATQEGAKRERDPNAEYKPAFGSGKADPKEPQRLKEAKAPLAPEPNDPAWQAPAEDRGVVGGVVATGAPEGKRREASAHASETGRLGRAPRGAPAAGAAHGFTGSARQAVESAAPAKAKAKAKVDRGGGDRLEGTTEKDAKKAALPPKVADLARANDESVPLKEQEQSKATDVPLHYRHRAAAAKSAAPPLAGASAPAAAAPPAPAPSTPPASTPRSSSAEASAPADLAQAESAASAKADQPDMAKRRAEARPVLRDTRSDDQVAYKKTVPQADKDARLRGPGNADKPAEGEALDLKDAPRFAEEMIRAADTQLRDRDPARARDILVRALQRLKGTPSFGAVSLKLAELERSQRRLPQALQAARVAADTEGFADRLRALTLFEQLAREMGRPADLDWAAAARKRIEAQKLQ